MPYKPDQLGQNTSEQDPNAFEPKVAPKLEITKRAYALFQKADWESVKEEVLDAESGFELLEKGAVLKKFDQAKFVEEVDLPEEQLLGLAQEVESLIMAKSPDHFLYFANKLNEIAPDVFQARVASKMKDEDWERVVSYVQSRIRKPESIEVTVNLLAEFKSIAPQRYYEQIEQGKRLQDDVFDLTKLRVLSDLEKLENLRVATLFSKTYPGEVIQMSEKTKEQVFVILQRLIKTGGIPAYELMRVAQIFINSDNLEKV